MEKIPIKETVSVSTLEDGLLASRISREDFLDKLQELDQSDPHRATSVAAAELLLRPEIEQIFANTPEEIHFYSLRSLSFFHRAQIRISNREAGVEEDFVQATLDAEKEGPIAVDWINYIRATIAYLQNDVKTVRVYAKNLKLNKSLVENFVSGLEERGAPDYMTDYAKPRQPDIID